MVRRLFPLVVCGLLLFVSVGAFVKAGNDIERVERGWVNPTLTEDLPERLPIAGVNVELTQYEDIEAQLALMEPLGFHWLRQPIYWETVEASEEEFDWSAYDRVVEATALHPDLELVLVIDGTPDWARHPLTPEHPFAPPASVQQFADFSEAVARRYGDRVDYYQIWDEPNIRTHWGNMDPRPATYVAMLQQAYQRIHNVDGNAQVITAALAPNVESGPENLSDVLFLQAIYDLGGADAFDAVAGKPYGFNFAPDDRTVDPGVLNFSRLILLREEMVRRGDGDKPLWGSNFGWNHLPDDWIGPPSIWGKVTAQQQIDYTYAAYDRAEKEWAWLGGLIVQHWDPPAPEDDPIQGFAILPDMEVWQAHGSLVKDDGLTSGHFPADVPQAAYDGYWQRGELGADARTDIPEDIDVNRVKNTIAVDFYGTAFAVEVRRDDYLAYLTVTIDGQNANLLPVNNQDEAFIVLTSDTREPEVNLVPVASGLEYGRHTAVITHRPTLGDDRWSVAGFAVGAEPDLATERTMQQGALVVGILALVAGSVLLYRLPWQQVEPPSRRSLMDIGDWALTFVVSAIFVVGVVLSIDGMVNHFLRREPPALLASFVALSIAYYSPSVWLGLIGLLAFAVIVFNRPLMGILAIIFWSVFFTATLDVHIRLIAAVEVMLAISFVAIVGKQMYSLARDYRTDKLSLRPMLANVAPTQADVAMLAFVGLAVVSLSWAELLPEAFRELRTMVIGPVVLYWLLRTNRLATREWMLIVDVVIFGGLAIAVTGLYNYISGEYVVFTDEGTRRLIGVYGSPNSVALHLGRTVPFALAYVIFTRGYRQLYGIAASGLMLLAILLTQSVGAIILGLPAAVAVLVIGWRGRKALAPLAGLTVAGLLALIPLSQFIPRLRNLQDLDSSTALFRINLWRSTVQLLEDHPITGVGLDQFLYAYRGRYILPEAWADPDLSHPHNWLLDYWVRLGILGVVIGVWLQVIFWRTGLRAYRLTQESNVLKMALVLGAMGSMANFLAHGLVDSAYFAINLSYLFVINLALVQWANREEAAMTYEKNGVRVDLVQGDITQLETDAITNAANSYLQLGAGVAGAIARAGGPAIQRECDEIGHCDVGDAVITGGGKLKAKHVIHAVGPRMGEGDEHAKLASAVRAVLRVANENGVESVALPAISTGIFGFPLDDAAEIFAREAKAYSDDYGDEKSLTTIVMCLYDDESYRAFANAFAQVWA